MSYSAKIFASVWPLRRMSSTLLQIHTRNTDINTYCIVYEAKYLLNLVGSRQSEDSEVYGLGVVFVFKISGLVKL